MEPNTSGEIVSGQIRCAAYDNMLQCDKCGHTFAMKYVECGATCMLCPRCGSAHYRLANFKIHLVPFDLMGVMAPLSNYVSGDLVAYGGMLYLPGEEVHVPDSLYPLSGGYSYTRMIHQQGNYASGGGTVWGAKEGVVHEARLSLHPDGSAQFYCS